MLELGKRKRVVACAFHWPGWDRSARIGADALVVLAMVLVAVLVPVDAWPYRGPRLPS
jgi:hypothetical protein